jgi:alpha-ketoglutarate-dependent taurine dioxygenase
MRSFALLMGPCLAWLAPDEPVSALQGAPALPLVVATRYEVSHHLGMADPGIIDLRPLSPKIGAEVWGLDLSRPLGEKVTTEVRRALCKHLVLFFPDQDLPPDALEAFASQFGEVTPAHPVLPSIVENPKVLAIDGREDRASWWHTDVTFLSTPPLGSILHMREAPDVGGDTMWVSLQAAYDGLAQPLRDMCDTLIAWHQDPWFAADVEARGGYWWDGEFRDKLYPTSHPVVRIHPETNRKGLFVNSQFTSFIEGFSKLESECMLQLLYRHCQRPEFSCRYRWRAGAVAFWDNRATLHYALDDYGDAIRVAHRVTLKGEVPYGPARPKPGTAPVTDKASSLAPK